MSTVLYGLFLALALCAWVLTASPWAGGCLAALILLPPAALICLIPARRLCPELECPASARKGEPFSLLLREREKSRFPRGRLSAVVSAENLLTGERLTLRGKGADRVSWEITSPYCGCLTFRLERLRVYDLFGIVSLPVKASAQKRTAVMPDTFPVPVRPETAPSEQTDSQEYAQDRRGQDRTETYQLRSYVPGDSLSLIHWKLSSKLGQMVVRDPALPVDRRLTVLFDRSWGMVEPARADGIGEAAASVCQALSDAGLPFRLVWTAGERLAHIDITAPEQLPEAVASLLKARPGERDALEQWTHRGGRLLYFSCRVPEDWQSLAEQWNGRALVCLDRGLEQERLTAFPPEHVQETLENFSWS